MSGGTWRACPPVPIGVISTRPPLRVSLARAGAGRPSLNIQRGRDHGLADYNAVRKAYGLSPVTNFAQITSNTELQQTLNSLYRSVDNIDLWVGMLAEDHVAGASVGQLAKTAIADQFQRLRDGDRFWYQRVFSGRTLTDLENTTLAGVIKHNTTITNLQSNVFLMDASVSGQVFVDVNHNGRQDRTETGLAGITVQLLDDEGAIIETAATGRDGRYRLSSCNKTGDYQVQILLPSRLTTAQATRDVLVSCGGVAISALNFGLAGAGRTLSAVAADTTSTTTAATDVALNTMDANSFTSPFGSPRMRFNRIPR